MTDAKPDSPPYPLDPPPAGNVATPPAVVQLPGTTRKSEPKARRKTVDLERLEIDFRAGKLTLRELGALHAISHVRVQQIATQHDWTRDTSARARAEARVIITDPAKRAALTERLTGLVRTEAEEMALVRTAHRELILTARGAVRSLMAEAIDMGSFDLKKMIEQALDEVAAAQRSGNVAMEPIAYANLVQCLQRAASTGGRTKIVKDLAMAADKLIPLERQAYDLDAPEDGPPPVPANRDMTPREVFAWLCATRPTT